MYEEAKVVTSEKLADLPGRVTIGIDGHKMGKRQVETMTKAKLGVSTFLHSEILSTKRATGKHLAELLLKYLDDSCIAVVADNTSNNTGRRTGLFTILQAKKPTLLCIGCCVHVLDLLVEDMARLAPISEAINDAHFLASFTKKHSLLYEEFLRVQPMFNVKQQLVLYPTTRFAYAYLMCARAAKNHPVLRHISESSIFEVVKAEARRRGQAGQKSLAEFARFEDLAGSRASRSKVSGAAVLLEPFSAVLHYLEGDSTPVSHVYPCYQLLYDYSQQVGKVDAVTAVLSTQADRDAVCSAMRDRWLGDARKKGLKDHLHFCAFALDPYAQAASTTAEKPECDLMTGEVTQSARTVFKHICSDATTRAILIEQFGLFCAAAPRRAHDDRNTVPSGNNAYSALYLTAMQLVWEKKQKAAHDQKESQGGAANAADDPLIKAVKQTISAFKVCGKPTDFWLAMSAEAPRGAGATAVHAHRVFCKVACELVAVVAHTAGVERAGKGYGMVLTTLRQSMDPARVLKAVYCLENYGLLEHDQEAGSGYDAYPNEQSEGQASASSSSEPVLPRGSLIVEDVPDESEESDEEVEGDGDDEIADEDIAEVEWYIPDGFVVSPKPTAINDELVGAFIFMKWEQFGWQLGKVTALITSATPRLVRKYNVRVSWSDGSGPCMLDLKCYVPGAEAPIDSWVVLKLQVSQVDANA